MANVFAPPVINRPGQEPPPLNPAMMAALMPPTSPSMGFQNWASDDKNAHKVVPAMTGPNQPLQPNLASVNPPTPAPMAAANPPGAEPSAPSMPNPAPSFPSLTQPNVQLSKTGQDMQTIQNLQQSGAAANHIKNPVLRTLAQVGNIAAPFLLGSGAMAVPGTTAHNMWLQQQAEGNLQRDQSAQTLAQQSQLNEANIGHLNAEAANLPMKTQALFAKLGMRPETDEHGDITYVPDENSPVYQQMQQKEETLKAQADYTRAGIELRNAQTAYNNAKVDPNSPLFKQTAQRLATAQANAVAAGERAKAYMGRYMQSAYNLGLDGQYLPGATQIANDNGDQTVVGTGNASLATKAQSNAAQFNDVHGALDTIENAAKALVAKGGKVNSPGVAAAMAQPSGTLGQWLQGEGVKANLTPEERNYVLAVAQAHENIQALRKSAGGTATDSAVAKLDSMIPNASTPDLNYLLGQTGQIRATAERLGKGATTAKGGLTVRGQNPMTPPTKGGTYKQTATGPNGHQIGSNDGGKTWADVKTGKAVQ